MSPNSPSFRAAFAAGAMAAAIGFARAEESTQLECFSTEQTREHIKTHKLGVPFASMRTAEEQMKGDALGARLCRMGDDFVYQISVLRHDGHVVKILVDAVTGRPHSERMEH